MVSSVSYTVVVVVLAVVELLVEVLDVVELLDAVLDVVELLVLVVVLDVVVVVVVVGVSDRVPPFRTTSFPTPPISEICSPTIAAPIISHCNWVDT